MSRSTALLDAVISQINAVAKDKRNQSYFRTVREYGGEFTSDEIRFESFTAPAAHVSCLGWQPEPNPKTLGGKGIKRLRVVVFISTKDTKRVQRFHAAMQRAEFLTAVFESWKPGEGISKPLNLTAENLYNRGTDSKGLALWMVSWWHEISFDNPALPLIESYPDFTDATLQTEAHIPQVTGDDAPEDDLTYETAAKLENDDEQGNQN